MDKQRLASSDSDWCDPIGAAYEGWRKMDNRTRLQLMLETAIERAMQGFPLEHVLQELATVQEFCDLGRQSFPMCRALTQALVGKSLEPNTMTFDELLKRYAPADASAAS